MTVLNRYLGFVYKVSGNSSNAQQNQAKEILDLETKKRRIKSSVYVFQLFIGTYTIF